MKKTTRILALVLALVMALGLAACGSEPTKTAEQTAAPAETAAATEAATAEPTADEKGNTLVVGYSNFNQKFSPFFATTAYDQDVASMTQMTLLGYDRGGAVVLNGIEGETRGYNGTDYFYDGIADCVVTLKDDGTVTYDFTLRDDIKFSDGEPMTIDDVIFSMYVYADPTYDGSVTFSSLPVMGMSDYRAGMEPLSNLILAAGPDGTSEYFTADEAAAYWKAFNAGGEKFAQEIVDYCIAAGYGTDVATAAAAWGYGDLAADATTADFFAAMVAKYGYDISDNGINVETAGTSITDYINAELGDAAGKYAVAVQTGDSAANISGIVRTGDYSMTVTTDSFDATTILQFVMSVAPLHYYGDTALYNYENNQFGFPKGDLSLVKTVTTKPMGAGPYKFVSYDKGVVTFEANENYWKGTPKTQYILFQEVSDADKLTGVATGTLDLSDPSFSSATATSIAGYNSNGELDGDVITTKLVDNNGYGYIGMCAELVKVGDDAGSDASKDLRKGFATLFAVYRDTVIASYYGSRATVIQYPITSTSWAAPMPADEGYAIAYSKDVDGNPIYTDGMTEDQKYAAALEASIGFFKAAGYTWDDATKTFTAAPEGASLAYELQIPGDGVGDHPAFGIVTNTATALKTIGIDLQITDLSDSSSLFTDIEAGTVDMWAAAWGNSLDPDMYQVYYSTNVPVAFGGTGTNSNSYCVRDSQLDELILAGRTSADTAYRKSIYKQCLDILLDWSCEVPTYQRKNAVIFSTTRVNLDTITPDLTPFWTWLNGVDTIELA